MNATPTARILYVEDDEATARIVVRALAAAGHDVTVAPDVAHARRLLRDGTWELVLLDWSLGRGSGLELCRSIRSSDRDLAIIFLTVRDDPSAIVEGLDAGADDYVTKPFDASVLRSRVRALLRRTVRVHGDRLSCGPVALDEGAARALVDGVEVSLTPRELELLRTLLEHQGRVLTRGWLIEAIWPDEGLATRDNTLTVTMGRLRAKLGEPSCIQTVRGFGYRMAEP